MAKMIKFKEKDFFKFIKKLADHELLLMRRGIIKGQETIIAVDEDVLKELNYKTSNYKEGFTKTVTVYNHIRLGYVDEPSIYIIPLNNPTLLANLDFMEVQKNELNEYTLIWK